MKGQEGQIEQLQQRLDEIEARVLALERATTAGPGLPIRARTAAMPSRGKYNLMPQRLQPHAEKILAWMNAGKSQQEIVRLLLADGVATSQSALSRFIRGRLMPDESREP